MATRLAEYEIETGERPNRGATRSPGGQDRGPRQAARLLLGDLAALNATGGRLLAMGAGSGYLLDEAHSHFDWRCGLELSSKTAEAATKRAGVPVYRGIEAIEGDAQFDCIVALDVLDQASEPESLLAKLGRHLAPGGTLMMATPLLSEVRRRFGALPLPRWKNAADLNGRDAVPIAQLLAGAGFDRHKRLPASREVPFTEVLAALRLPVPAIARHLHLSVPAMTARYVARRTIEPCF